MQIATLACDHCGTEVRGRFAPSPFSSLSDEQRVFVLTFLRCRGNIRQVERELDISYPTVRNRLEDVLHALGIGPGDGEQDNSQGADQTRRGILHRVQSGEMSVDAALIQLGEV